ncbi:hypothetical protein IEQ34_019151 [Dendrobium chrysotoxum]|uniref:Uncharacterized protein n=1 Tax=Dendrobium chrysotoxum TaxID=161865 RepID=A0AAV7G808_DENCH|nr:hypothetical protein IEQ34_019151 [Dendrobium chrysotoxum]
MESVGFHGFFQVQIRQNPKWNPARLEDVNINEVETAFEPLPPEIELNAKFRIALPNKSPTPRSLHVSFASECFYSGTAFSPVHVIVTNLLFLINGLQPLTCCIWVSIMAYLTRSYLGGVR